MEAGKGSNAATDSNVIWKGTPTHWVNLQIYVAYVVVIVMLTALQGEFSRYFSGLFGGQENFNIAYGLFYIALTAGVAFRTLENHMNSYELTNEVFREQYGVLNRVVEETELYRVADSTTYRPFHLMIFGYGNVILSSTDRSSPITVIKGIRDTEEVRKKIRELCQEMRRKRGIVEIGNY
ncbi:MAG: PH domain-containing protein [Proteobacteria bacterium]|nr:PH domain-containing protein [Pseudomonadota bacterium]